MSEKAKEKLNAAIKNLQIADHLTYVTFPLIGDDKIITAAKLGSDKPLIKYGFAAELLIDEKPGQVMIQMVVDV